MRVAVVNTQTPFVSGGAEALAASLSGALERAGHEVARVAVPAGIGPTFEHLSRSMASCRALDLETLARFPVDRVIALKYPSWEIRHPRKSLWIVHPLRQAYDLWAEGLGPLSDGALSRDLVERADRRVLDEARVVRSISSTVARRLSTVQGRHIPTLYPPTPLSDLLYSSGRWESFFFFPSRLSPLKRHDLVFKALARTAASVRLVLAGAEDRPGDRERLERLAEALGVADRVTWEGFCRPDRLLDLYSRARCVVFPPRNEDFGFVTAEAQLASRPVITCLDSGGPLELIRDQENGLVVEPRPAAMAAAMALLAEDAELARRWGEQGRLDYLELGISWARVLPELLA